LPCFERAIIYNKNKDLTGCSDDGFALAEGENSETWFSKLMANVKAFALVTLILRGLLTGARNK